MSKEEMISVGMVTTCHGLSGELRVKILTDFPERFDSGQKLFLAKYESDEMRPVTVKSSRWHNDILLVLLNEVMDRTAAEAFRGFYFWIKREEVKPLAKGNFYIFDLEGLDAFGLKGEPLGKLTEVIHTSAYDVYVIKGDGQELLVPAFKKFVKEIDMEKRIISIDTESLVIAD